MPIYSDIEQTNPTSKTLAVDISTVYQSITNILNTPITERFFNPEFGSEMEEILFEPMDSITEAKIFRLVIEAIERWEPRVRMDYGKSTIIAKPDDLEYEVSLVFQIIGLQETEDFIFSGLLVQPN